ncbi:unnamed protein product [Trichobilharzia szidati]|nr:unnamed protein product [Trichobilharzia szidati]CAH8868589.1 unnamed protein product [Trichobilharzia szidati]
MPRDYERRPRSSLHYGYGARSVTYELSREHWDGHYYPDYCGRDVYGDRHEDDGEERDRYGRRRHGLNQSEERWRRCSRPRSRSSERETEAVVYVEGNRFSLYSDSDVLVEDRRLGAYVNPFLVNFCGCANPS